MTCKNCRYNVYSQSPMESHHNRFCNNGLCPKYMGDTKTVKGICMYKYKSFNRVWRFLYERYQKILRRK